MNTVKTPQGLIKLPTGILRVQGQAGLGNGYLYNWYAASDANFCPTDWKLPSLADYQTLSDYLGGDSVSGGKLKEAGFTHWNSPNTGTDNSSGFTALGSGFRSINFNNLLESFITWTNQTKEGEGLEGNAYYITAIYNSATLYIGSENYGSKFQGESVRLLYTGAGTPSTVTDYDGNVYPTVVIGTQRWITKNWKCTRLNNGDTIPNVTDQTTWAGLTTLARCAYNNDESNI